MKFIILLLFLPLNLALSIGSQDEEVSTQLSDEIQVRWLTNISMEIKLPNNTMDTILLIPASNIPGVPTPCLFSGKLEKDKDSVVAVSGCQDNQETSLSIASRLVTDALVDLSIINGTTFILGANLVAKERLRFKRQTGSEMTDESYHENEEKEMIDESYYDYDYENEENDYVLDPNPPPLSAAFDGPLPQSVVLHTSVVYDNSLLKKFGGSHSNTKQWLSKVVELTKPRMKHNSLNVAIHLRVGEMKHRNDQIKADADTIYRLASDNKQTNQVVSFFCEDVGRGVIGIAFLGTACRNNGRAININEYSSNTNSELKTARTFAHELGHNMDMRHDFHPRHGGRGNPCNGKGLMSYGNKPDAWSSCSNKDFDAWYRSEGSTCLISELSAPPPPTTTTATTATTATTRPAPVVSGSSLDFRFQCFNILTNERDYNDRTQANYWLSPDKVSGPAARCEYDIGGSKLVQGFIIKNTHNYGSCDRATRNFTISVRATETEDWMDVVNDNLGNVCGKNPVPVEAYNVTPIITRFIRFTVESYYGRGGGLQFLVPI